MDPGCEFRLNLNYCNIDDHGCKYLVRSLHNSLDTHRTVSNLLSLNMSNNAISHHGLKYLSNLLEVGCVKDLNLFSNNPASEEDTLYTAVAEFSEQLKTNISLKRLNLERCGLISLNCEGLSNALIANKHLEELNINQNALGDDGIQHLAHALRFNQGLKQLHLVNCSMTDEGLRSLAKSLQDNCDIKLNKLDVHSYSNKFYPNHITENIVQTLTECLQKNNTLTQLCLPMNLRSSILSIEETVGKIRMRNGLPFIEVLGMSPT